MGNVVFIHGTLTPKIEHSRPNKRSFVSAPLSKHGMTSTDAISRIPPRTVLASKLKVFNAPRREVAWRRAL
jgi:hypothetical protein